LLSNFTQAKDTWGALLGAALLGTGVAWRLGLSPVTGLFVMGVCLSLASRHASQLRLLLCSSEPGVLLPMLLLAGALLRLPSQSGPLWVVAAAVGGRLITRWALGFVTASVARSGLQLSNRFGLALCCTGTINALLALSFALRFPGTVGDMVLATAAIGGITGDLVGAIGLRQALVTSEPEAVVNAT
jgi:Kef-type K+ transport system membrane component KefB